MSASSTIEQYFCIVFHTHTHTNLLRPGSLDKIRIHHLRPALLTLHVGTILQQLRDDVPPLTVLLYQLFEGGIL